MRYEVYLRKGLYAKRIAAAPSLAALSMINDARPFPDRALIFDTVTCTAVDRGEL